MSDPVLTATQHPITPEMRSHPLATRAGIELLVRSLEAYRVWSKCTPVQRRLLDGLCRPIVERLKQEGELCAEELPALPAEARASTRGSMSAAGLITIDQRITARAVHAWYYAVMWKEEGDG